jgi:hypothetical protein
MTAGINERTEEMKRFKNAFGVVALVLMVLFNSMAFAGRQFTKDFLIEVQKGLISGHSIVHKFGRNDAVPNGSFAHISLTPFDIADFRTSAVSMRVKAGGNAADTAAGAGAREVTIQGIDSSFSETSEAVATAGASASSATTATFWRVHRAWVSSAGTYTGANTGAVVIEDSGGGADFITIAAGEGQTQYCGWTVPTGKTAYILSVHLTCDSVKPADIRLFTRDNIDDVSAPMDSKRLKLYWDGITGVFGFVPRSPNEGISEKSDIWFEAQGSGASTEVSCDFELLLVDN